jgi:hypothetical protein
MRIRERPKGSKSFAYPPFTTRKSWTRIRWQAVLSCAHVAPVGSSANEALQPLPNGNLTLPAGALRTKCSLQDGTASFDVTLLEAGEPARVVHFAVARGVPVAGVGHAIGTTMLLALVGARFTMIAGETVTFALTNRRS